MAGAVERRPSSVRPYGRAQGRPEINHLVRRIIAVTVAVALFAAPLGGCSQPIDNGSSIPAQSQPIVALLALIGVGIGLTAWHHHNEAHEGSGGGGVGSIVGAQFSVAPFITGYKPVDLVVDTVNVALGALELPTAGSGTGKFTEIQDFSNTASPFGTYTLPASYAPTAVAMDANGLTWFDDANGHVQGCAAMAQGEQGTCASQGTFSDGLGAGSRSMAVDINFILVVTDAGGGKVKWWATDGSGDTGTGTYASSTTASIYSADSVKLTTTPPSGFTVFHQDGSSDFLTFTVSGSSLSISAQANFIYSPASLVGDSGVGSELSGKIATFGFTGAPSGSYSFTKYETSSAVGLGQAAASSQLVDLNGQVGNPSAGPFTAPLSSPQFDTGEASVWAIDSTGRIVNFAPF